MMQTGIARRTFREQLLTCENMPCHLAQVDAPVDQKLNNLRDICSGQSRTNRQHLARRIHNHE